MHSGHLISITFSQSFVFIIPNLFKISNLNKSGNERLKNVGDFVSVINLSKQLESTLAISADASKILGKSLEGLSATQILAKTSTMGLTKELQLELIQQFATDGTNYDNVESLTALSVAQTTAATSTTGLSTAVKGLKASLGTTKLAIMGAFAALTIGYTVIRSIKQAEEELRQSTEEVANAYKETSSSINDYVTRYKELHQALLDAKGNEEETYNIKKQLLDLQTELNDKFGEEYGKINLVTDAYKDQTDALKEYNNEAAKKFLNENQSGIEDADNAMKKERHYMLSPTEVVSNLDEGKVIKELVQKYASEGMSILESIDGTTFSVHLNATAESAYDTISAFENDLRAKADELGNEDLFDDVLKISSDALNDAKSTIDDYGEIYRQSLLAEIATDDKKSPKFNELISDVEEYNEAVLKSEDPFNDEDVATAREKLKLLQKELSGEDWEKYGAVIQEVLEEADTKLIDFYNRMKNGPDTENVFGKVFNQLGGDNFVDELTEKAEKLRGLTRVNLESMAEDGDNGDVFDEYRKSAESYGLSVEELIDVLIRLGKCIAHSYSNVG